MSTIKTQRDYNEKLRSYQTSGASEEARTQAIIILENNYPQFSKVNTRNQLILKDIELSSADKVVLD